MEEVANRLDVARLPTAALWGAWATAVMSVPMLLATIIGASPMPEPVPAAGLTTLLGTIGVTVAGPVKLLGGLALHLGYGAFWAAALWAVLRPVDLRKGLALGLGLWILMGVAVMPILGWGPFGVQITPRIAVVTLLLHVVYGASLGWAFPKVLPRTVPDRSGWSLPRSSSQT